MTALSTTGPDGYPQHRAASRWPAAHLRRAGSQGSQRRAPPGFCCGPWRVSRPVRPCLRDSLVGEAEKVECQPARAVSGLH